MGSISGGIVLGKSLKYNFYATKVEYIDGFLNKEEKELIGETYYNTHTNDYSYYYAEHSCDNFQYWVKDNLQKAATMLSDKGLKEGWFSKPLPKESVVFEVYLPFMQNQSYISMGGFYPDALVPLAKYKMRREDRVKANEKDY